MPQPLSASNRPDKARASDNDFTVDHYRKVLMQARQHYEFTTYDNIPWGRRFILWRHDCDFSLNRALVTAKIEAQENIRSTYFFNPHSEFYNIHETSQLRLVKEVLACGHQIGLHFDAAFHNIADEAMLETCVSHDADILEALYGVRPKVFSFHNPVADHMRCDAEHYAGLINCYSRRFQSEVAYCSDSNGYWRFQRLHDVLAKGEAYCIQVLTHPEWWQDLPMPPRQRIFRSVYGRAHANMQLYDAVLEDHGRSNLTGASGALEVLRENKPRAYELADILWNRGEFATLYLELWRQFETMLLEELISLVDIDGSVRDQLCDSPISNLDTMRVLEALKGKELRPVDDELGSKPVRYWSDLRIRIMHGKALDEKLLEDGCIYLCKLMEACRSWADDKSKVSEPKAVTHANSIENLLQRIHRLRSTIDSEAEK